MLALYGKVTDVHVLTQSCFSRFRTKIVDRLHLFRKVSTAGLFCEMQYPTPAVKDTSEAPVSAMQRQCFDGVRNISLFAVFPVVGDFERLSCFGKEVLREATSWMYQPTSPFSGCVILFLHGQCPSFAVPRERCALPKSHSLKVERKVGGRLHLKLKKCLNR